MQNSNNNLDKKLFVALERDDVAATRPLIEAGADLQARNNIGEVPLYVAARRGNLEHIDMLLDAGANINFRNAARAGSALNHALSQKQLAAARHLLQRGADPRISDGMYRAAAHHLAIVAGDVSSTGEDGVALSLQESILARATELGYPIDQADYHGDTALGLALAHGAPLRFIERFLISGASANALNREGRAPLHRAWKADDLPILRALVNRNADINCCSRYAETPLFFADDAVALAEIVKLGGDVRAVDVLGRNALAARVFSSIDTRDVNLEVIGLMLDLGLDPNQPDFSGETATALLARSQRKCADEIRAALASHLSRRSMRAPR